VVKVAMAHHNGIRGNILHSNRPLGWIIRQHPEVEQERFINQYRTPTDLLGSAQELHLH
jgi:hypothetical protein